MKMKKFRLIDRLNGIVIETNSENALEKLLTTKFVRVSPYTFVLKKEKRRVRKAKSKYKKKKKKRKR